MLTYGTRCRNDHCAQFMLVYYLTALNGWTLCEVLRMSTMLFLRKSLNPLTYGTQCCDDHFPVHVGVLLDNVKWLNPVQGAEDEYNVISWQVIQPHFLLFNVDPGVLSLQDVGAGIMATDPSWGAREVGWTLWVGCKETKCWMGVSLPVPCLILAPSVVWSVMVFIANEPRLNNYWK